MKTEKTVTDALHELYTIAESFISICALNKVVNHLTISDARGDVPVISDIKIEMYQPENNKKYCLKTEYTQVKICGIKIGEYGSVAYKLSLTYSDIHTISLEAKKVLEAFKVFNFGSLTERAILSKNNDIKRINIELRKAKKEKAELEVSLAKYKG